MEHFGHIDFINLTFRVVALRPWMYIKQCWCKVILRLSRHVCHYIAVAKVSYLDYWLCLVKCRHEIVLLALRNIHGLAVAHYHISPITPYVLSYFV